MTDDHLLGGRIRLAQPERGYRAAIDPVLLAASIQAGAEERILDAGCGTGAAALCLAARLPGCRLTGVELDPDLAALARANAMANGCEARLAVVEDSFDSFASANRGTFDQVMSNPPFHQDGRHTRSPRATRAAAHGEGGIDLAGWVKASAMALKAGGRLTLIHRADRMGDIMAALQGRFGAAAILPLWPKAGVEAKRILVSAIKGRRTLPRLLPGLVLHEVGGGYTCEAEAILRDAVPLDLGQSSA